VALERNAHSLHDPPVVRAQSQLHERVERAAVDGAKLERWDRAGREHPIEGRSPHARDASPRKPVCSLAPLKPV
jgi:hypothetical protein